jgi:hypothetical protein
MRIPSLLYPLAFAIAVAGCRPAAPEDSTALVLRTYDVPHGSARAIVYTLKDALWLGEQKQNVGRAVVTPDGRLAVLATTNVQTGVQALIDEISKHPPTYDQSIELHYYVLVGKPAASPQPSPAGVGDIQAALDEIVKSQGPQAFTVAHRVSLSTLNGESGTVEADKLKITQKAAQTNDGIDAIVGFYFPGTDKLESRVQLVPDRVVVLGAASQHTDSVDGTLYYVVRVAPHAGGKKP